jgi:hypothetical protein
MQPGPTTCPARASVVRCCRLPGTSQCGPAPPRVWPWPVQPCDIKQDPTPPRAGNGQQGPLLPRGPAGSGLAFYGKRGYPLPSRVLTPADEGRMGQQWLPTPDTRAIPRYGEGRPGARVNFPPTIWYKSTLCSMGNTRMRHAQAATPWLNSGVDCNHTETNVIIRQHASADLR